MSESHQYVNNKKKVERTIVSTVELSAIDITAALNLGTKGAAICLWNAGWLAAALRTKRKYRIETLKIGGGSGFLFY